MGEVAHRSGGGLELRKKKLAVFKYPELLDQWDVCRDDAVLFRTRSWITEVGGPQFNIDSEQIPAPRSRIGDAVADLGNGPSP